MGGEAEIVNLSNSIKINEFDDGTQDMSVNGVLVLAGEREATPLACIPQSAATPESVITCLEKAAATLKRISKKESDASTTRNLSVPNIPAH